MFHGVPHNNHDVGVAPILDFHRHEPIMVYSQAADNQITQNPRAFRLIPTGDGRGLYMMFHLGFYPHHPHTRTMFEKDRPYAIINDKSGAVWSRLYLHHRLRVSWRRQPEGKIHSDALPRLSVDLILVPPQWILIQEDFNTWSVRSLSDRGFLSVMEQPRDGVKVVGNPAGGYWEIQPILDDPDYYRYVESTSGGPSLLTIELQYHLARVRAVHHPVRRRQQP